MTCRTNGGGMGMTVAGVLLFTAATLTHGASADAVCMVRQDSGAIVFTNSPPNGKCDGKVYLQGTDTPGESGEAAGPGRRPFERTVEATARRYGVSPKLVHAVIQTESGGNPAAVSSKGALGVMQLMPATAQRFEVSDPMDPEQNIEGGVRYLSFLLDQYGGDTQLALAAYNAGEGAVDRYGGVPPYRETREYVRKVSALAGKRRTRSEVPSSESAPPPSPIRYVRGADGSIRFEN